MADYREFLSVPEAAEFLRISISQVYRLTSQSAIPHYKVGKRCVFSPEKLKEWVETQAVVVGVG